MFAVPDLDAPALEIPLFLSPPPVASVARPGLCGTDHRPEPAMHRAPGRDLLRSGCRGQHGRARIHDGDMLVVDRSSKPVHGSVVVAAVDGEFTVKQLQLSPSVCLLPGNPAYRPIHFSDGQHLEIFGVVTFVIHKMPAP